MEILVARYKKIAALGYVAVVNMEGEEYWYDLRVITNYQGEPKGKNHVT